MPELEGPRKGQYAASERRLGLVKEVWAIRPTPAGELYVACFAGAGGGVAFAAFAASQDKFDRWFKGQVLATGADLNSPPPGPMSEILSDYQA